MCFQNFLHRLNRKFTLVFLFTQVVNIGSSSPAPEDWVSGSPFSHFTSDDTRADTVTSAFLNVTFMTEDGWKWDKTDVGRYGGGYIGPAFGELIHVTSLIKSDDHWGCQLPFGSSRSDRQLPPLGMPWIALIKRGKCNFEVKVENAFRSSAAGVLVYNDRDSASLDKMKLSSDSKREYFLFFLMVIKFEFLPAEQESDIWKIENKLLKNCLSKCDEENINYGVPHGTVLGTGYQHLNNHECLW
ncbi:hypothetical protein JTB14_034234 [Gonioctena quinquepunctata]|nr:hypothetical protein JTB14_034234 [Gonioctena quinquepunctata]